MGKRTDTEIREIIKNCRRIEKEGGDMLAYLASEHYISPAATWANFQRYDMRRRPDQMTDGKAKPKKEETQMAEVQEGRGKQPKVGHRELIGMILANRRKGISEEKTLKSAGYVNVRGKMQTLREWAQQNDLGLLLRLEEDVQKAETVAEDPEETAADAPAGTDGPGVPDAPAAALAEISETVPWTEEKPKEDEPKEETKVENREQTQEQEEEIVLKVFKVHGKFGWWSMNEDGKEIGMKLEKAYWTPKELRQLKAEIGAVLQLWGAE